MKVSNLEYGDIFELPNERGSYSYIGDGVAVLTKTVKLEDKDVVILIGKPYAEAKAISDSQMPGDFLRKKLI